MVWRLVREHCTKPDKAKAGSSRYVRRADFGSSGEEIVIEEFMEGRETSLHLIVSGQDFSVLFLAVTTRKLEKVTLDRACRG